MVADVDAGAVLNPSAPDPASVETFVRQRQPEMVSYKDWLRLNDLETQEGESQGRPRVKFTDPAEMLAALR